MASDETPAAPEPEGAGDERLEFAATDKAVAAVLLLGALGLAYICLDVMAGGRITQKLAGRQTE